MTKYEIKLLYIKPGRFMKVRELGERGWRLITVDNNMAYFQRALKGEKKND